ncbi:MAG TPA: hypothetical protein VJM34_10570 [Novosphingobium sp.]|nr:hypothetical protein [Novosphingobium sp.]
MSRTARWIALAGALLVSCTSEAQADFARPDYLGTWQITSTQPAPWINPADTSTSPHDAQLLGKTITYERTRIIAPPLLACDKPAYAIKRARPEGLFQGGLTDPKRQALELGFQRGKVRTLETGCEGWFEYHFLDAQTAMFALDNMIYTIRRR